MPRPNTLFARTALVIATALLTFILLTGLLVFHSILSPLGHRAADDLAALMVLSANTWVELPPGIRPTFVEELKRNHRLLLREHPPGDRTAPLKFTPPYMRFLQNSLSRRLGRKIEPYQVPAIEDTFWFALPTAGKTLHLGFAHDRLGANPVRVLLGILIGSGIFVFFTTLFLARLINRPLARLAAGVRRLGHRGFSEPLPEEGPRELALLARKVNELGREIQQLLDNRTILLGGISHDLRTPLARLEIAVELLDCKDEAELLRQMRSDLKEMNEIIGRTLELAGLMRMDRHDEKQIELVTLLREIHADHVRQRHEFPLLLDETCKCQVAALPLRRILGNLLENAFHHGGGDVILTLHCKPERVMICVLDSGSGVPEAERERVFQPFHRLEPSRNTTTGGSGLGLAIARQIAESRGWKVILRNRQEGGLAACVEMGGQCLSQD